MAGRTRVDPADLVGAVEVAEMLGWAKTRVDSYASRGYLPEPVAHPRAGRLWTRQQIEAWARERGVPIKAPSDE